MKSGVHWTDIGELQHLNFWSRRMNTGPLWPTVLSVAPLAHCVVCLSSVCDVLHCGKKAKNCLKKWIGNQGQKVHFLGSPQYYYLLFRLYGHWYGRFCLIFARTAQRSVLDGTNKLSSSKSCAYCWIVRSELKPEVVLATIIRKERCK